MQVVRGDAEIAILSWRNAELAPQCIDVLLLIIHPGKFHHVVSCCRMGSIRADHEVKVNFDFWHAVRRIWKRSLARDTTFEPRFAGIEIGPGQFMIKEELHIRRAFQLIE